jgi:hypothetical protein
VAEFGEFTADELEARRAADDREADRNRALIRRWME